MISGCPERTGRGGIQGLVYAAAEFRYAR